MKEIMFKICELCGKKRHIDEMVGYEKWCIYCDKDTEDEKAD